MLVIQSCQLIKEREMTKVVADITMSLDGFVTGPNAGPDAGLGNDGGPLHDWVFHGHEVDEAVLADAMQRSGAVVMGRNLFDVVDGPDGWSDDMGYGAHRVGRPPFVVETPNQPAEGRRDLGVTLVTEGGAFGVTALDGDESGPVPVAFVADTVKV